MPKLLAALLCAALVGAALVFPFNQFALGGALFAYAALLWFRPNAWLLVVPALLPVLDLAPWTGWFFLDELDLLLLATAAFGYARIRADDRAAALPVFFSWSLGLVMASALGSAAIGLLPWAALDANAFSSYSSHFNGLRVAKGFAWALLLLPLARRAAGPDLEGLARYFIPGMLLGLAGACLPGRRPAPGARDRRRLDRVVRTLVAVSAKLHPGAAAGSLRYRRMTSLRVRAENRTARCARAAGAPGPA